MKDNNKSVRLYPWYVHLAGGWSLGGLFPWFLVVRQFFSSDRKKTALLLAALNISVYLAIVFFGFTSRLPWDKLALIGIVAGLLWSICAWVVQYSFFGLAPRRYIPAEWKNWIIPICVAIILGIGLSVVFSIFPMISNRIQMYQARDLLTRDVILWDFFRFVPISFLISIPLGIWWAGERERFTTSRIISYVFGLIFFYLLFVGCSTLFFFLISLGHTSQAVSTWPVTPLHPLGLQKFLLGPLENDYSTYFIVPLILGLTPRIRDFFLKSLMYFPLLCVIFIGYSGYSHQFWQYIQGQILYQMSSEVPNERARAHEHAELLLARFPDHRGWPVIGLKQAHYEYFSGDIQKAFRRYQDVYARASKSPRWMRESELAKSITQSSHFGDISAQFILDMPAISYESYMTNNWMSLLRVIRYYEQKSFTESQTLIRLKALSTSDTEIKLSPMPTLAELDDSAGNLGYKVLLLPAQLELVKKLIKNGYPVIQPIRHSFNLLYGIDDGRAVMEGACYKDIRSAAARAQEEALANTGLANEAERETGNSRSRINELAKTELPFSFWGSSRQEDTGPLIAVVVPEDKYSQLIAIAGDSPEKILTQSDAYLTGLIGLNALKTGDIDGAVKWSIKSYSLQKDPFPLHIAHLAKLFWDSRKTIIGHNLGLDRQLPKLIVAEDFLTQPTNEVFLDTAKEQFDDVRKAGHLSWMVRNQYIDLLDRSNTADREIMISLLETTTAIEPFSRIDWARLAELHEWNRDNEKTIKAYQGALYSGYWDNGLATHLAYLNIQTNQFEQADRILNAVSPKLSRYNPDYYYCLGSIENWKGNFDEAGSYLRRAIKMRKYDPNYHLAYANLLEEQNGPPDQILKLRDWAAQLNGTEQQINE